MALLLSLLVIGAVAVAARWVQVSLLWVDRWSIGVYASTQPWKLQPPAGVPQPVLTAADVSDVQADFVADPFLVRRGDDWLMFLEVYETQTRLGSIAWASSSDGRSWRYEGVVLREPFHLSYPVVLQEDGRWYLLPERGGSGSLVLYEAAAFPQQWRPVAELLQGEYYDATPFRHADRWWMFACTGTHDLCLFTADALTGPWAPHPANPIVRGDVRTARPAGRVVTVDGQLHRLAQDGYPTYGSSVRLFRIQTLARDVYAEVEATGSPILEASGSGWNASGMHHVDLHRLAEDGWMASVDGNHRQREFNWRAGLRGLQRDALRLVRQDRIIREGHQ